MEHLPLPEGTKHFIFAPYEAPEEEWYNNLGFLDFPQRRGWTEEQLRGQFGNNQDARHQEQFFQTWLFFGLVIDVLAMGGVSVTTEDFLQPKGEQKARIVDTSKLPNLLVQWRPRIEETAKPWEFKLVTTWDKLEEKFDRVKTILNHFCLPDENKSSRPPDWPVRDEISTTIIALAFSLRQAAIEACGARLADPIGAWPGALSKILTKRIEHKWCLAETNTALKELSIDGHYYIAASPSPGSEYLDRHYNCLPERCLNTMDEDLYFTRHADAPWHKQEECQTVVEYGGHLASDRSERSWVDSVCRMIDKGAIPLAHWKKEARQLWSSEYDFFQTEWADGMGNPGANWLPECQLDRITHLIESICWKSEEPSASGDVCFWMDTLCVPVQAENKARRKQAIASMRNIYSNARGVLVLDSWLQQIPSTSPMLTIITRLYQSNWLKRLWTHQEGFLPSAVYIQFSDRAIALSDLDGKYNESNKQLNATGIHLRFPSKMNQKHIDAYGFHRDLVRGTLSDDEHKWMGYAELAGTMYCRQTSRLADETVCLASLLDLDLGPLLAIPDKPDAEAAEQRMAIFLQQLKKFEAPLIFNNYERLNVPGFQWAPKSLLNFRSADTGIQDEGGVGTLQEMNGEWGLLLRYSGFVIKGVSMDRPFAIKSFGSLYMDGKFFIIQPPPNSFCWDGSDEYAVVLSKIPRVGDSLKAVIGPHRTELWEDDIHVFEHRLVAKVELRDDLPPGMDELESQFLNRITQWFIR